jgi:hypothetical protein
MDTSGSTIKEPKPPDNPRRVTGKRAPTSVPSTKLQRLSETSSLKKIHLTQADGLDKAYQSSIRMYVDPHNMVFIPGTDWRNLDDLQDDDLIRQGKVRETHRYKYMLKMLNKLKLKPAGFVGHSLGAAVARALGEDLHLPHTEYSDPTPTWEREPGNFRNKWDPVAVLNMGAETSTNFQLNPHDFHDQAMHRSADLMPDQPDDL